MDQDQPAPKTMAFSALAALAGLVVLSAPFTLQYTYLLRATINDVIIGLLVFVLAGIRFFGIYAPDWMWWSRGLAFTTWPSWIVGILGLWLLTAPFALGYSGPFPPAWTDMFMGIVIAALGFLGALTTPGLTIE